ncbi:MAG: EamA family transporter [Gemmatimonadota bacterium]
MKASDTPLNIPPITGHIVPAPDEPLEPAASTAPPRAAEWTTDAGLLALVTIWGVNFTVIKFALEELHPLSFNALRFPVASLVVYLILRSRGALRIPERRHWPALVALGLLGNTLYQLFFIFGIDGTGAGNAALLLATTPVWTILLATLLGHERGSTFVWIGAMGTVAGMALVIAGGGEGFSADARTMRGDLLMVGSSMVWASYSVGTRNLIRTYGSLQVTAWTLWAGTVGIVLFGVPSLAAAGLSGVSGGAWAGVLYAGALAVGLAYSLWNRGIGRLGSARTSVYSNLVPVVALVAAWLWLSEVPAPMQITGALVILGSLFLARFGGRRPRPPGAEAPGTRTGEALRP